MTWFKRSKPPSPAIGATVVAYRCDGCMAHDHIYLWVGVISGFEYPEFMVTVQKRDDHRDIRGHYLGTERINVGDGSFQKIAPNLYFHYR